MRRQRFSDLEAEESTDRWLVSYADFITLLFAFFVVMYSISNVNLGKYRVLSNSVMTAFSAQSNSPFPIGSQLGISVQRAPIAIGLSGQTGKVSMKETAAELDKRLKKWVKKGMIAVKGNEKWLEIEIKSNVLFQSGEAVLSREAGAILAQLTRVVEITKNPLYVSGYTDNVPIKTGRYPSNWELSAARSSSVVRLLASNGINPARMGAIGYGEFRPIAKNDSDINRQKNRRVVIRIMTGEDMFGGSSPFDNVDTAATIPLRLSSQQITRLQPGEPIRTIFGTP
ncbi:Flagellar motor rotation protein MotB [hydrothermal vent metagenome]|uniref:Flagellar motor rotation protein MotB n=1 Tax=hydrothermal vent metagenome TaxID=652676 RepID=A0A3B0WMW1_9ZZZZ